MKVLILGMGNPILSDDGVGLIVAEALRGSLPGADVTTSAMIGLGLLDEIVGYDAIFVIDAMTARSVEVGELRRIVPEGQGGTRHLFTSHGINFFELMELGALLNYDMPEVGGVYGIGIGEETDFGERLSPRLAGQLPAVTRAILADILSRAPFLTHKGDVLSPSLRCNQTSSR